MNRASTMENANNFESLFKQLTGHSPFPWQVRLFELFLKNEIPEVCDLPTGLGKTSILPIWLLAFAQDQSVPRRLVYVVDRRTVVDQATELAEQIRAKSTQVLPTLGELNVSTLRGQLADNRKWSTDPSKPAIIIGTVDLIGSALLFSGYRSSFKRRPLEAGLLGQDSLLVLDEAHLSKPFEKLVASITRSQHHQGSPMRVISMSATVSESEPKSQISKTNCIFRLGTQPDCSDYDLLSELDEKGREQNQVRIRYEAKKQLWIKTLSERSSKKPQVEFARTAIELAQDSDLIGKRLVVFVRSPDVAKSIAQEIRNHVVESVDDSAAKPKKIKSSPFETSVEVLAGTMRGLERDMLVQKDVFKQRWLNGDMNPSDAANQSPVFLISTSAGEVGLDLNADHLIGDSAPFDSWIQRLGRVNRRGHGQATVIHIRQNKPLEKTDYDKACNAATDLLTDGMDVSPKALGEFKHSLSGGQLKRASSPDPMMVELTDILLDNWSMTSITETIPGRPEVAPWLRGVSDEQAQTTIAWRMEVDLFRDDRESEWALQKIFSKHRIRPHESLTVNTGYLVDFLKRIPKLKDRPGSIMSTLVALRLPRGEVRCQTLQELIDDPRMLYSNSMLILPSKFGGLDSSGMLDVESVAKDRMGDDQELASHDVADQPGYEQREDAPPRMRMIIRRFESGEWKPEPFGGSKSAFEACNFDEFYQTSKQLVEAIRSKSKRRIRLVQPVKRNDDDDVAESLVLLSPVSNQNAGVDQSLDEHVNAVETEAKRLADSLKLADEDPIRIALLFAAKWHDEGKKAHIWQFFANNPDSENGPPIGKMAVTRDPKCLRGYRHEFGSLLRIHHPDQCGTTDCQFPVDSDACDLALHLIATHHGAGRPHFNEAIYVPFSAAQRDLLYTDCVRRFARLQRKYGWWRLAWLENLLRCADALASADPEAEDDPIDVKGTDQ